MDIIEINNLRLRTVIGFSAHELESPQDLVINLRIGTTEALAGESDDPKDAFNYKPLSKAIIQQVEGGRFALVEKLAEEIACLATVHFAAPYAEVSVHKPGALRRSDSVGIRIERRPEDYARNVVYVSLGSNIAPEENVLSAVSLLRRYTTVLAFSPLYRTAPQGYVEQKPFLNMAAKLHTRRSPAQFKCEVIDRIEKELQRVRDPLNKNAPRTIDLDISLWNDEVIAYGNKPWKIPDGDITRFAHVAIPLAALAPDLLHPTEGKTLREIAAGFDADDFEILPLDLGRKP